ncbi:FAD-binding oxidoreductase, partial [Ruegeria sp.]|uniref:FAD-binding oxidoreductase n=1 Tax=Ruegeria sp. TaxID=1879320 RepID=UPI00231473ED
ELAASLSALLGPEGWKTGAEAAPYSRDWLDRFGVAPLGVARPATTEAVAETMRLCHQNGVAVVAQGGNTGLVGGSVAARENTVILSLSRMNQIESIDPIDFTATVGPGVVLAQLHEAVAAEDLHFPLHLGSEGSAQIGGLIACNAGGSHAFRFGMMQDLVLGLEVVLPDGRIWNGARRLIKDNAGFQLRKLFAGSEGRLGVVTKAVLRLFPAARDRATALIAVPDRHRALALASSLRADAGEFLTGLEFFEDPTLDLALRNVPSLKWPLQGRSPFYVLAEVATSIPGLRLEDIFERALEHLFENDLAEDAVIASSEAQRLALWAIREELPEGARLEGRQIKHDIAVPVSQIAAFVDRCSPLVERILPGVRIWVFGHLADGNIHYNLSPPVGQNDFAGRDTDLSDCIYRTVVEFSGSFAAEHGMGRTKVAIADMLRSPVERDVMRRLHRAIDPDDIMNPGVVV